MNVEIATIIITNVCGMAYFIGTIKSTQESHSKTLEELKGTFEDKISELKTSWRGRYEDLQEFFDGKFMDLAKRQDKHNCLMERTFKQEQINVLQDEQIKVANHRIEDIEDIINGRN